MGGRINAWMTWTSTAAAMLLAVALNANAQTTTPAPRRSSDFAGSVTWYGQVPIMVAIDKGYFKEQGLDVEYPGDPQLERPAGLDHAGSISVQQSRPQLAIIPAMARGDTSFYYFANVDDSPGNEGCWARPGIASFKDLRGKKVAANTSARSR